MGPLTQSCCLLVVLVGAVLGRPSAEITSRDARGQTIADTSDPFWVFPVSGNEPSVYTPLMAQPHPLFPVEGALLSILPATPEVRRKPLLAVLDLLQRRYNLHDTESYDDTVTTSNVGIKQSGAITEEEEEEEEDKRNTTSTEDSVKTENVGNTQQVARIYALLDTLVRDHPDTNNGFSYAFKYHVPPTSSKLDNVEVSVQQSLQRFPQVEEDPLSNRLFKTPLDYKKVQEKLDAVLEGSVKTGGPVHLNTPGVFGPLLLSQYSRQSEEKVTNQTEEENDNENPEEEQGLKPTKLILRPVAKAVAGPKGIAVASPMARAVLRRGQPVSLEYEPDAVAIAGPGGRAHAHPELSVDYIESAETKH